LEYGVTFSQKQAERLNMDWREMYRIMLDDMGVKKIRLSAYWDDIEKEKNSFNWQDLDWQIDQASKRDVELIVAVGARLPRWPECHFPEWYNNLGEEEQQTKLLEYVEKTILRYKDNENIKYWQVENEPFLKYFGECPKPNKNLLDQEIALVKSLDDRDVIVTDSGELSLWVQAAGRADIFGTTMYRDTFSRKLEKYIHYPIAPGFFRFKKNISNIFTSPKDWIVIELQGEPWGPIEYQKMDLAEKQKTMSHDKFVKMIEFSSETGFQTFYWWGVEYWYWEWRVNGDDFFWNEAKKLLKE